MVELERFMYSIFGSFPNLWIVAILFTLPCCFLLAFVDYTLFQSIRDLEREAPVQMVMVVVGGLFSLALGLFAISAVIYRVPDSIPITPDLVLEEIGTVDGYDIIRTETWAKTKTGRYKVSQLDHMIANTPAYITELYYLPYLCLEGEKRCYRVYRSVSYANDF